MKLFTGLESDGFSGSDADFSAGARIAADTGLAWADAEDAETAQFNTVACGEGVFKPLKYCIYGRLGLGARQAGTLDHVVNNILLDQCRSPFCEY